MRIPPDAIIPSDKLTKYLLAPRARNDKSRLLGRLGFTTDTPGILEAAIRRHAAENTARLDEKDEYGDHFVLRGKLIGPIREMEIESIWVRRTGEERLRFVTLKPFKDRS